MKKTLSKLALEDNIYNLIKTSYKKLNGNIALNGGTESLYKNKTKLTAITTST